MHIALRVKDVAATIDWYTTFTPLELLVRIAACGVCWTDLKKVDHGTVAPPRVFGHEMAGVVERAGDGVTRFAPGDRVQVYHHIV